jgi:hypothetical protein
MLQYHSEIVMFNLFNFIAPKPFCDERKTVTLCATAAVEQ